MIVRCPVCGTPFHHRAEAGPPVTGRCSVCDAAFPLGSPRNSYRIVHTARLRPALAASAGSGGAPGRGIAEDPRLLLPAAAQRETPARDRGAGGRNGTAAGLAAVVVLAAAGAIAGWYGAVHLDWPLREAALAGSLAGLCLGGLLARWMLPARS